MHLCGHPAKAGLTLKNDYLFRGLRIILKGVVLTKACFKMFVSQLGIQN